MRHHVHTSAFVFVLIAVLATAPVWGSRTAYGSAGANDGGTLILHATVPIEYTSDTDYCGLAGLTDCSGAVTRIDQEAPIIAHVIAAFFPESEPRLKGIVFGIDYDPSAVLVGWKACGDFELAEGDWPAAATGTAVTWSETQTADLIEVYWFAAYSQAGAPGRLELVAHPIHGGFFADDAVPSNLDPIAGYGALGFFAAGSLPCPEPHSACCLDDGSCLLRLESQCETDGGIWQGEGVSCNPNPCPQPPVGACCFQDGSCQIVSEDDCLVEGGVYQGDDTACDPNPCPQPLGACCFPDGACQVLTADDCGTAGGAYQGGHTLCDPNPCPQPTGACCFQNGSCQILGEDDCAVEGGVYQGDETACDPNPCPQPLGACCLPDGACEILTADACVTSMGTFQGDDTLCEPNPCPIPTDGACCLSLGTCEVLEEVACAIAGGAFRGVGAVCAPNPCPQPCEPFDLAGRASATRPAPPVDPFERSSPIGMVGPNRGGTLVLHVDTSVVYSEEGLGTDCALGSGVEGCEDIVARADLEDAVVVYAVALFPTGSAPRLVGLTFGIDYPECVQLLEWQTCGDFEISDGSWPAPGSGTAMTWAGPQTDLAIPVYRFAAEGIAAEPGELALAVHPTHGALFADDSIPAILDPIAGLGSCGFFRDGVTPCPQPQEPIGACCFGDGTCSLLGIPECDEAGGVLYGVNVPCSPNPCPQPIHGACCFPDGSCLFETADECSLGGGEYQGDDVSCSPNPCPQPVYGACCLPGGTCQFRTDVECAQAGGDFQGEGVPCNPNPCPEPTGACCISGSCEVLTREACSSGGGTYLGDDTSCEPNPCGLGACCFPDGSCQYITSDECASSGGIHMSAGTSCDPNPCPHGGNYCGKERTWEERVDLVRQVQNARAGMETPFALETGRGSGALQDDGTRDACGTFLLNTDQSYENGYAWSYGGVAPPYYGAFAEGYVYPSGVACSVILDLTQIGYAAGQTLDAYAWADAAGYPGAVVNVSTGRNPGPIAFWPNLSRHVFPLAFQGVVSDLTWVGYWGNWPGAHAGWFVGADLDGFGGCPVTNIAPGIGYPTGWNNVSIIWGPTQAIGCGGEFIPGGPTVVRQSSWGEIKALFR